MNEAAGLVLEFVKFAAPLIGQAVDLRALAVQFWGDRGLGPLPPDLEAWDTLDADIDRARAAQKASP